MLSRFEPLVPGRVEECHPLMDDNFRTPVRCTRCTDFSCLVDHHTENEETGLDLWPSQMRQKALRHNVCALRNRILGRPNHHRPSNTILDTSIRCSRGQRSNSIAT